MLVPVHFFLAPDQREALEAKLAATGPTREQALLQLLGLTAACEMQAPSPQPATTE